jgi:hypothetical protein
MWQNFVHLKIVEDITLSRGEFKFLKGKKNEDVTNEMSLDKGKTA